MAIYKIWEETEDFDLAFENGDYRFVEDQDAIQQQLGTSLRESKEDWFLDLALGLRWVDNTRGILGANELSSENEADMINIINNVFGVTQLVQFASGFITNENFQVTAAVSTEFSTTVDLDITV